MAKFRFRMQSILSIKEKMEDQAKQQFAAAKNRLDEEERKLQQLQEQLEQYLQEGERIRMKILDRLELQENEQFIQYTRGAIVRQQQEVRKAELNLERARVALQDAMVERKTYEKLKEKAFEEFKQDLVKQEGKEVDELTSYVYGKKEA